MTWGICNVQGRLDTVRHPAEAESLVETSLHIFWEVSASLRLLTLNLLLYLIDISSEICDIQTICTIAEISVRDEAHSDRQTFI